MCLSGPAGDGAKRDQSGSGSASLIVTQTPLTHGVHLASPHTVNEMGWWGVWWGLRLTTHTVHSAGGMYGNRVDSFCALRVLCGSRTCGPRLT